MKERLSKSVLYIAIGVFGLGYIMLRAGRKNDNTAFIGIGIALMSIGGGTVSLFFLLAESKLKKLERENAEALKRFKSEAEKVKVNLEEVEIKTNNWVEKEVIDNSKFGQLDEVMGDHESNIVEVDRNINYVKIGIPFNGKIMDYIVNLEMDPTTLSIHFAIKKETFFYFKGEDFYLDLEFLD